jgi:spore coat polysaccharide biosynthesis protein SpsF
MNSKRLPGKVMKEILGKPILWHLVQRLKHCKNLDEVVISTGSYKNNKEIHEFTKKFKIPLFSGSEGDVIDRIYQTAKTFDATIVVRITADCPFMDPKILDEMISIFIENLVKYDILVNNKPPTFPHGLDAEIYSFQTLDILWNSIKKPELREWFPLFIEKNSELFRIHNFSNNTNLSHLRWTVDYQEDFEFTQKIFEKLYHLKKIFLIDDILELLEKEPELSDINSKYVGYHNVDAPKI